MNSTMKYKNFMATIHYDDDDKIFWGEVLGIKESISFHGESVSELQDRFHLHIDEYLERCKSENVNPEKNYSGTFNIRIKPDVHKNAAIYSSIENISLNQYIAAAVELMNSVIELYNANKALQISKHQLESYLQK